MGHFSFVARQAKDEPRRGDHSAPRLALAFRATCAVLFTLLLARAGRASLPEAVVAVDESFRELPLGRRLELAYDPAASATAEDVIAGKLQFAPSQAEVPSFGYRPGAGWARFTVDDRRRAGAEPLRLVLGYAQADHLECFEVARGAVVRRAVAGDQVPLAMWDVAYREPTCLVGPGPREILVRTFGEHSHQLPLTLVTRETFEDRRRRDVLVQSLFFGALLVMAAYNALVAVATRSAAYTYYVGHLMSYGTLALAVSGLGVFVEPSRLALLNYAAPWGIAGMGVFSSRFAAALLGLDHGSRWGRWLRGYSLACFFGTALVTPFSYAWTLRLVLVGTAPWAVLLVGAGIIAVRRGSQVGGLFLAAWAVFIVGSLANVGRVQGFLPANALTANAQPVGAVVEFLLLSFALSHRIKELQAEATRNAQLAAANAELAREASQTALEAQHTANAELRRLDRLKDEFLANTSHELRTPLNGILGLLEVTLDGTAGVLPSPARRNLELVRSSGRRLGSLVNDLLDFSKLREKSVTLHTRPLPLHAVVDLTLHTLAPLAADKELRLVAAVPIGLGVSADEGRLQQILTNLVGNAIKFTESGCITVQARERGGRIEVRVQDTGIGIAAEAHARIFESFEQADGSAARKHGGTGLGLAVTKRLVELHGGSVVVESAPGEGSTFSFDLEAAEVPAEDAPLSRPVPQAASILAQSVDDELRDEAPPSVVAKGGLRVLVVDDEPINREVLAQHLAARGFDVLHAQDGEQAIERIANDSPDVVLLDVMMPKKTGYDVLAEIRPRLDAGRLPVLLLTAKAQESDIKHGFSLGASDYLLKPVSLVELDARLGHHARLVFGARALAAELDERRRLQGALDRATSQLTQAEHMATLGMLMAGIAHDLRNPLNYVQGASEVLRAALPQLASEDEAARGVALARATTVIGWIEDGTASMGALSLAMRNQARMADGEREAVSLEEVVPEALLLCASRTRLYELEVNVEPVTVLADPTGLGQLMMNLVSNAADAVCDAKERDPSAPTRIALTARVFGDRFSLVVEDSGKGIPEDLRARVLEPFFTTKPRGKGTGLGLAIVQRVVRDHAGTLDVGRSTALGGARFEATWAT